MGSSMTQPAHKASLSMTYRTIHTLSGLQAMASAEATGTPINLTHMAVGDGDKL